VNDGLVDGRCWWASAAPENTSYHDNEWGRPEHDSRALYEKLCLEAFQSGLSWITILRKRESFRRAFAGFEVERVAAFGDADVARLMADASIIRNRAKIEASIANARAVLELDVPLSELLWSFAPDPDGRPAPASSADVPAVTPESTAMAKELKRRGFRFVGPTTAYALMQACGLVNDHLAGCRSR
jgi:DNA-3-methyladenine glycosylase I